MKSITLEFEDSIAVRILNGFTSAHGYQSKIADIHGNEIDNPQTKKEFLEDKLIEFLVQGVEFSEVQESEKIASDATRADIKLNIIITKKASV